MEFRMLGPLRVRTARGWVPIAAEQQRTVLAVLLVEAGRAVSTVRLVDAVWGPRPPSRAVNTVQAYVMRLRRLLGGDLGSDLGGDIVLTRDRGYELAVDGDHVDAVVFERMVSAARRDLADGQAASAEARLSAALDLWRGPVLADVPAVECLTWRADQLEQIQLAAQEQLMAALLALDRSAEAVEVLHRLVDAAPLREQRWALLVRALDRCGRRAEALDAFQRARRVLRDELGLEPGPELRELQRAILSSDPSAHSVRPAQLPSDTAGFVGRVEHLARLDDLVRDDPGRSPSPVVSVVSGAAGTGKTALAVHWAHGVRDRFPDGQLYLNLRGYASETPVRPLEALGRVLAALGVAAEQIPSDVEEASALYRSLLADRRVLVLLDNARDPEQVRPLLPGGAGCLTLVTSRDRLGGLVARDGASGLVVGVLDDREARAVLTRLLGPARVDAEPEATAEVVRLCGNLPLALRIAAARLSERPDAPVAELAGLLAGDRLGGLDVYGDTDPGVAVRAAFDLSYRGQPADARRLFRLLGLAPGADVTAATAGALAGQDAVTTLRTLDRLASANLIAESAPGRYAVHDLLREYAAERAAAEESPAERAAALDRLYARYLAHAGAWIDAERANVVSAVAHAAEHGPHEAAWLLADAMRGYLFSRVLTVDRCVVAEHIDKY
jgi:DNA-binding SARP family transcriptional activator